MILPVSLISDLPHKYLPAITKRSALTPKRSIASS
jgi:hypothetical protein